MICTIALLHTMSLFGPSVIRRLTSDYFWCFFLFCFFYDFLLFIYFAPAIGVSGCALSLHI